MVTNVIAPWLRVVTCTECGRPNTLSLAPEDTYLEQACPCTRTQFYIGRDDEQPDIIHFIIDIKTNRP